MRVLLPGRTAWWHGAGIGGGFLAALQWHAGHKCARQRGDRGTIMGLTPLDQAGRALQDTAALWSIDAVSPQAVVSCACDALIAGLDSPSLRILADLTRTEADYHVRDILPAALAELGLDFYPRDSRGGQEAAARALAAQAVSGSLTPRELAAAIHRHFAHNLLPLTERLAVLDDVYDLGFDPGVGIDSPGPGIPPGQTGSTVVPGGSHCA